MDIIPTPYLIIDGAAKAIDFYKRAFGAEELFRMARAGRAHRPCRDAHRRFDLMLADESPSEEPAAPQGSSPVHLVIYCEDVDKSGNARWQPAARSCDRCKNQFYGDAAERWPTPSGTSGPWHARRGTSRGGRCSGDAQQK